MRFRTTITSMIVTAALVAPLAAAALTQEEIQAQINALLTQIRDLKTQLNTAQEHEQNMQTQHASPGAQGLKHRICGMLQSSLHEGDQNDQVRALQEFLQEKGLLAVDATGFFGTLTLEALRKWQAHNGIISSGEGWGVFGPRTRLFMMRFCKDVVGTEGGSPELSNQTSTSTSAGNQPPTIESFDGPSTLVVNTNGTWSVHATDPDGGTLSYHVAWGDRESVIETLLAFADLANFTSATTFTHAYSSTGLYLVTIRVSDGQGGQSSAVARVRVEQAQATSWLGGLSTESTGTGSSHNQSDARVFSNTEIQCVPTASDPQCMIGPARKCTYNGQEYTENQTRSAGFCLGFGTGVLEGRLNSDGCVETTYVCRTGVWLKFRPKLNSCNMGGQMYPSGTVQNIDGSELKGIFGSGSIGTSTCVDGEWIAHYTVNSFNNSAYTSRSCKYAGATYADGEKAPCTGLIQSPDGYSYCAPPEGIEWAFNNVCRNGEWKQEDVTNSGGAGDSPVSGLSCTTSWGNQTVAHTGLISKEPYFTNGAYTGAIAVPKMKCNNGSWLQCDNNGNFCQAI